MKLPQLTIAHDIKLHLQGGLLVALGLAALLLVARHAHPALAIAIAGPAFGWGLEKYQAIRKEGVYSVKDIIATAAPFEAVAAAWFFLF